MAAFHAKDRLLAAAQSYYNDEQFSDFTITCEGREFKVHRCFISPHSKFFEKACSGMFKEAQERKVDMKEDDPTMVELMVKFFYTFDYTALEHSEISPLDLHTRVYTIADKYEVLGLKSIALAKFKSGLHASYQDGKAMVEATRALTACRPLPNCDTTLHDLMTEAWYHGGEDTFASGDKEEISSLFEEVVWLPVAIAINTLGKLKKNSLRGRCWTGKCTNVKELDSRTVMAGVAVRCGWCQAVYDDKGSEIIKVAYLHMKKSLWEEPSLEL